jgi:hypothetical protein
MITRDSGMQSSLVRWRAFDTIELMAEYGRDSKLIHVGRDRPMNIERTRSTTSLHIMLDLAQDCTENELTNRPNATLRISAA